MVSRLTDKQVLALKAASGKRVEVFDPQEPGLMLRVSDAGRRTWFFRYRLADGRQPRLKLGTYPATGIADARLKAQGARRLVEAGKDPAALERKAEAEARAQKIRTFEDLIQAYFVACEAGTWIPKGKRKKDQTIASERSLYERHIKKEMGRRPFGEIGRPEIKALTRGMLAKGITTQSNHAHALVRQAFSYAVEEEIVEINPAMGLASPAPKKARERVLSDAELKAVWGAFKDPATAKDNDGTSPLISKGVGIAVRLAALLLQRRAEIATMRAEDVDLAQGVWVIPADRAKNGRTHAVPLPPAALQLVKDALAIKTRGKSPFVFPSPRAGETASIHPDALTRAMGHVIKALGLPLAGPHDLRRTGATALASERLGITPFIVSQVLNHVTDTGGGSATTRRHYNFNVYATEKRAALAAWEGLLLDIAEGRKRESNVTMLRKDIA
jgi:integrase